MHFMCMGLLFVHVLKTILLLNTAIINSSKTYTAVFTVIKHSFFYDVIKKSLINLIM